MTAAIVPPATVVMLGGGQLGRYALAAARQMGYRTAVLDPDPDAPAGAIADVHLVAGYDDERAVAELCRIGDVATVEFEHPPAETLEALASSMRVAPNARALFIAQDRIREKRFLESVGCPVGAWRPLEQPSDLDAISTTLDGPVVVKTARFGYDGKGQRVLQAPAQVASTWRDLGGVRCVVEQMHTLRTEVSVIVARSPGGEIATYPVTENTHRDGILDVSVVPGNVDASLRQTARSLATHIVSSLEYIGVLAVEFFVAQHASGDQLLVNELAPRPHNSGHWTIDASATSQFEQQVRAVCGLPLGETALRYPAVAMANVLGEVWEPGEPAWERCLGQHTKLHLYGKTTPRPGRKMGHLTVWGEPGRVADDVRARRDRLTGPAAAPDR